MPPQLSQLRRFKIPGQVEEEIRNLEGRRLSPVELAGFLGKKPGEAIDFSQIPVGTEASTIDRPELPTTAVEEPPARIELGDSAAAQAARDLLETLEQPISPERRGEISSGLLQQYQGLIDLVNEQFATQITEERIAGVGRLGRQRAIQARGGILGTGMGEAQVTGVRKGTEAAVQALQRQRLIKIEEIFGKIDERAERRVQEERARAITRAEKTLELQEALLTETREDIKALAAQGVKFSRLDEEDKDEILEQTGWSEDRLKAFWNSNLPVAEQIDYKWKIVGNKVIGYGYDPETGEVDIIEQDFDVDIPEGYETRIAPDGTFLMIPENLTDPNQIIIGPKGQFAKPKEPTKPTSFESKKALLDKQLAAGTITQAQYNEALLGVKKEDVPTFEPTSKNVQSLLGAGFTESEAQHLLSGVRDVGLETVIEAEDLTEDQEKALREVSGEEVEEVFLTKEFLRNQFTEDQFRAAAREAGFTKGNKEKEMSDYLNHLWGIIEQYKGAGYSDQEILKLMK